jgi:PKD repeat protein
VTDWSWNFGDGTTSVERSPKKTYGKAGTYTVKQFAQTIKCDGKTAWVSYTAKVTVK